VGGELDVLAGGRLLRQTLASGQIVVAGGRSPLEPVEYLRNRDSASGLRRRVVGGKSARISRAVFPVAAVGAMRRLASALTIFGVHGVPPVTAAVASPRPSRLPLPCPTRANLSAWLDGGTHTAVMRCGQAAGGPALAFSGLRPGQLPHVRGRCASRRDSPRTCRERRLDCGRRPTRRRGCPLPPPPVAETVKCSGRARGHGRVEEVGHA
jgi:hypothetical protein